MAFADLDYLRSVLQEHIVPAEQGAQIALHAKSPADVEGLLHPVNSLNKALCRFDGLIDQTHGDQRSENYVVNRDELIAAAQDDATAGVSPINQISGLTQGFKREAPFSPVV